MLPANYWFNLQFNGLVASTATVKRTRYVFLPDDYILTEVCITTGEHVGTLTVTIDNGAMVQTITMEEAMSLGFDKMTRYYADTNKPVQLLLRGSELTVTASTTNPNVTSTVQVSLGFLSEWRRS